MYFDNVVLIQLLAFFISWIVAQLIKLFLGSSSKEDFILKTGGFPSSHTSAVSVFVFLELFFNGLTSIFALSFIFLVVVIVDAISVRYATGVNAQILMDSLKDKKLKDSVILKKGHTKLEIFAGLFLGFVLAALIFLISSRLFL